MQIVNRYKFYLIALAIWALAVAAKYKFQGLVFGFDYGTYQPDGKFYTYMALDFLNQNPVQSAQQVVDWYSIHGFKMNTFTIQDLMPETSYAYPVISHRILYPLLSIPFVALFGIPGMLAIPALSLLALFFATQSLANKFNKPLIGLGVIITLSFSTTVMRWMMVNCTDALLVGLFAFLPLVLLHKFKSNNLRIVALGTLILLTSATRFVLPFWLAIILILLFRERRRFGSLFLVIFSIISALPALSAQLSTALLPADQDSPTSIKLLKLPIAFARVVGIDLLQFGVLDRVFLLFLILCFIQALRLYRRLSSQLFLAVLFAGYTIGAINGTIGVNFRYQIPVLIFASWIALDSLEIKGSGLRFVPSVKGDVIVNKTEQKL